MRDRVVAIESLSFDSVRFILPSKLWGLFVHPQVQALTNLA